MVKALFMYGFLALWASIFAVCFDFVSMETVMLITDKFFFGSPTLMAMAFGGYQLLAASVIMAPEEN